MQDRIIVLVDGASFFYMQRDHLKWWIDPKRMLDWIAQFGEIVDAIYYIGYEPNGKQMSYLKALSYMGYSLVTKELKFVEDEYGEFVKQANMDCDLVADMFLSLDRYDTLYLVSGSTNFASSVERLRTLGKGCKVLSTGSIVASETREASGMNLIDFDEIRAEVEKNSKTVA